MNAIANMTRLHIQNYLTAGGDLDALASNYLVKAKRHSAHGNLVLLKYGIDADFTHPMVRECRGIILDEARGWAVVSRAFDKFGNDGESYVPEIDWTTARVQEKLDGSLCVLYHYAGDWHVATSGSPDASGEVQQAGMRAGIVARRANVSFADYFWEAFRVEGGVLPEASDLCFAFELMGPLNRVVVVHETLKLRLLSARNRVTGQQHRPEEYEALLGIPAVRAFPLTTLEEIRASFERISPVSQEGYVVVDGKFDRVKIKHPGYVALHHAKDGMGPRAFVEIARTGEVGEVISAFPEFRPLIDAARDKYARLVAGVRADFARFSHHETQKAFALDVKDHPHSAALFRMRQGKAPEDFFREVPIDRLMRWMGVEVEEESREGGEDE